MGDASSGKIGRAVGARLAARIAARRKSFRRGLARHPVRQMLWGLLIGVTAALVFMGLRGLGALQTLELKTYDWRMMATRRAAPGSGEHVAMLYVDEPSLVTMKEMGISWPWPRELYAGALEFAKQGGARAVVFDLFFSEDSSYGLGDDEAFARGIAEGPPSYFVIFASAYETEDYPPIITDVLARSRIPFEGPIPPFMPRVRSLQSLPVPEIADTATGFGNAQTRPDVDGVYRRVPLMLDHGGAVIPQIGFKVASDLMHLKRIEWPERMRLLLGNDAVPLDEDGNLMINYVGGVDSFPAYPLAKILLANQQLKEELKPDLDPSVLDGRVVIIGVAAPGLYDLKPMPLAQVYPGPEIHATVIASLLQRNFIRPLGAAAKELIVFAMALGVALSLSQLSRFTHIIALIAGAAGAYVGLAFLAFSMNLWLPVVAPLGAIALAAFTMILKSYMTEGRKKSAIKKAFGQYLSPAVVDEIAQNPDYVRMGGEEKEVSIFFSDIADFTSIAERMPPAELVSELCSYLSGITEIITGREGTLDKYIGDAVMAFWGAPLAIPDHAAQAALAALEIQRALERFPRFRTRIGIHTGRAVIGNVGSNLRFNYTVIGDAVNLASRLEGLNKRFGTRVIISENTYLAVADRVEVRRIGRVRVKGRTEPIAIYEPLCVKGELGEGEAERMARFEEALEAFMAADFSGARAAFERIAREDDPVVAYYRSMCDRYADPRVEGFDGVITFEDK